MNNIHHIMIGVFTGFLSAAAFEEAVIYNRTYKRIQEEQRQQIAELKKQREQLEKFEREREVWVQVMENRKL